MTSNKRADIENLLDELTEFFDKQKKAVRLTYEVGESNEYIWVLCYLPHVVGSKIYNVDCKSMDDIRREIITLTSYYFEGVKG